MYFRSFFKRKDHDEPANVLGGKTNDLQTKITTLESDLNGKVCELHAKFNQLEGILRALNDRIDDLKEKVEEDFEDRQESLRRVSNAINDSAENLKRRIAALGG